MIRMVCERCGGNSFFEQDGYRICRYCKSKFVITHAGQPDRGSGIALIDDIQRLLRKCQEDPANARKYAELILDIDPGNREAFKYLRK